MQYVYNLGQLFRKVATTNKEKPAIKYHDRIYSFGELDELSGLIASILVQDGISAGDVVGVFHNKSVYAYALMIACLKIGAPYVNFDISSPVERLRKITETCSPKMIVSDFDGFPQGFKTNGVKTLSLQKKLFHERLKTVQPYKYEQTGNIHGHNPAYIMFTSGSTGFPKGAVMSHDNVLKFIAWGRQAYEVSPYDVFTNVNPMYFDNSVYDFYISIFNGASLIPFSYETVKDPRTTVDYANKMNPTVWFSVPSMLVYLLTTKSFASDDMPHLRIITFGGEGFPKPKLKQLYDLYGHRVRFVNVYGPTECTCMCSSYDIRPKVFEDMKNLAPLGKIAPNFKAVILNKDSRGQGELGLGGPHVGLGYYNDPERSAGSFIQNPYNKKYREIIYKTGDLVKQDEDGILYFLGRVDNQIKHMGYRIELEEVEAAFNTLDYINECGVVYKKLAVGGQIICFANLNKEIEIEEIHKDIKKILPPYMIPKSIRILDQLPKNQNGKIDRGKLKEKL